MKFIIMSCGFAEDQKISNLFFSTEKEFSTTKEAIANFAEFIYSQLEVPIKECCQKSFTKDAVNFCSVCGKSKNNFKFNGDLLINTILSYHDHTLDQYGYDEFADWQVIAFADLLPLDMDNIIYIPENAEKVLLAALIESKSADNKNLNEFNLWRNQCGTYNWEQDFKLST